MLFPWAKLINQESWRGKWSIELDPRARLLQRALPCTLERGQGLHSQRFGHYTVCQKMSPYTNTSEHSQPEHVPATLRWITGALVLKPPLKRCNSLWESGAPYVQIAMHNIA